MSYFIPKISKYKNCLAQWLKKSPQEWNSVHTEAVQQLKKINRKASSFTNSKTRQMDIGQTPIEFLGMIISDGKYTLQPHIASSLKEFPDKLSTAK